MASIELYINQQLCEIDNPDNFSVYLKRQLLNPAELSTKDAQRSYDITLPASATNNQIFGYINTEEVKGKFSQLYDAQLLVDGITVFDGKFKISEITKDSYKGNLGVPAKKTVKDIFGETMMNQAGKWLIPFKGINDMTTYNNQENAECIFPLVLYRLLPKFSIDNTYSPKDVYDDTVKLGLDDFRPSINVIEMLKKIFKNANYTLTGSAINDERLKNLYVSYKNPNDYKPQWGVGKINLIGSWSNIVSGQPEQNFYTNKNLIAGEKKTGAIVYNTAIVNISKSNYTNIRFSEYRDKENLEDKATIVVPFSGLYKIEFNVTLRTGSETYDGQPSILARDLSYSRFEIKIARYPDDEAIKKEEFDNSFFVNNLYQTEDKDESIYPKEGAINFIDPRQNSNFICGFSWGFFSVDNPPKNPFKNPASQVLHNPMAISGGYSWDMNVSTKAFSAVKSDGYVMKNGNSFKQTDYFKVNMNSPIPYTKQTNNTLGNGSISQIIWLNKGEKISIVSVSKFHENLNGYQWYNHNIDFDLKLTPFMEDRDWLKIDNSGTSIEDINWNDTPSFPLNTLDLINFLPSNSKVNDWIDSFCNAFNLRLENINDNNFDLNIKSTDLTNNTSNIIDLDKKANVKQCRDQPIILPSMYQLGFTIDNNEEGYIQNMNINMVTGERILNTGIIGGGQFYTGSYETNAISQISKFSYNWYKQLYDKNKKELAKIPVISEHEIWEFDNDYAEMESKDYFDKAQRFWYKAGVKNLVLDNNTTADIALVRNEYIGKKKLILDYENKPNSIMRSYFLLFTDDKNYTIVDTFLSPEEYTMLPYSFIKLNDDFYYVAEIDGYDPSGRKKAVLKLIRKTL